MADFLQIPQQKVRTHNLSGYRARARKRLLLFLNMAAVYILHSKSADEFYTGSSKDVDERYE